MGPTISRESYIDSEDVRTGRGLTYDLFVELYKKMDDLKCSDHGKQITVLETKIDALVKKSIWTIFLNADGKIAVKQIIMLVVILISIVSSVVAGTFNADTILNWVRMW